MFLTLTDPSEVVLVVGVFDLFHVGHVNMLRAARALGDRLVVVVNGDRLTSMYKRPPIISEDDRLAVVQACRFVDYAEISNEYSIRHVVLRHRVTKIVHGDDWEVESYKAQIRCDDSFLKEHGVAIMLVPYTPGVSTSETIRLCAERATAAEAAIPTSRRSGSDEPRRGTRSCDA